MSFVCHLGPVLLFRQPIREFCKSRVVILLPNPADVGQDAVSENAVIIEIFIFFLFSRRTVDDQFERDVL